MNLETEEVPGLSSTYVVSNINFQNPVSIRITLGVRAGNGPWQIPGLLSHRF